MSGGHFFYAYSKVEDFAEHLLRDLHSRPDWIEYPETRLKLIEIQRFSELIAKLMKEAEWLYSGDTSDDTFLERVKEIEAMSPLKLTYKCTYPECNCPFDMGQDGKCLRGFER